MAAQVRPEASTERPRECSLKDGTPKRRFPDRSTAILYLRRKLGKGWRRMPDWGHTHIYRCPACGWWHVGHGYERR
jgi:hypothetical protein